jgi:S-DNA-T family DNA segregation ATPase FtsK/SpoIIIE
VVCSDVVLWGIDLKGGMEFGPWAACLDRLATTPAEAAQLLGEAVAVLNARATRLAKSGERLWRPTPTEPALFVVVDEYAELSEHNVALVHADSIARRGRAVAVTLLAATQRPTQKAMGAGAVRSQMDVRLCLRVRERRDVDLILGQGMLTTGWHAHTLDAPGKFLISTPEHTTPRRARAYHLTDDHVHAIAYRWTKHRPILVTPSQEAADDHATGTVLEPAKVIPSPRNANSETRNETAADASLWIALSTAPPEGITIPGLMAATDMSRPWVYKRLAAHHRAGRTIQVTRGHWRAAAHEDTPDGPA